MDSPNGPILKPVETVVLPPLIIPQSRTVAARAVKGSITAAVIGIGLNMVVTTSLSEESAAWTVAGIAAMLVVWAGILAGLASLIKAWQCRAGGVMVLAVASLLLNSGTLAMAFVETPILQRWAEGPRKFTQNELNEMPSVVEGWRVIIEPELGFRVEIPSGLVNYPEGWTTGKTIHSDARYRANGRPELAICIERLRGMLPANDKAPSLKEIREAIPDATQIEVTQEKWKKHTLDVCVVGATSCKGASQMWVVRVPLLGEAVEIAVFGWQRNQAECADILRQMLKSLKGNSNWD